MPVRRHRISNRISLNSFHEKESAKLGKNPLKPGNPAASWRENSVPRKESEREREREREREKNSVQRSGSSTARTKDDRLDESHRRETDGGETKNPKTTTTTATTTTTTTTTAKKKIGGRRLHHDRPFSFVHDDPTERFLFFCYHFFY